MVNPQFADVENYVEKLNTYWVRNGSKRCSEHIHSAIKPPSATPSYPPFLIMGVFLGAAGIEPWHRAGRSALARRGLTRRSLYPLGWGQRECRLGPPLTKPGRLGSTTLTLFVWPTPTTTAAPCLCDFQPTSHGSRVSLLRVAK